MHGYFVSQRMLFHFGNMEYCLIFCMFGCLWMFFMKAVCLSSIRPDITCLNLFANNLAITLYIHPIKEIGL